MRRLPRILRIVAAAVSLVISLSLFCGSGVALSNWAAFQLGPALARLAAAFTFGALGIAVLILALTFLVFHVLDWYNPLMAFSTNPMSSTLLLIFSRSERL